eukprot:scaffold2366_cov159-Amphora_coffeaeformis.AAC.29
MYTLENWKHAKGSVDLTTQRRSMRGRLLSLDVRVPHRRSSVSSSSRWVDDPILNLFGPNTAIHDFGAQGRRCPLEMASIAVWGVVFWSRLPGIGTL